MTSGDVKVTVGDSGSWSITHIDNGTSLPGHIHQTALAIHNDTVHLVYTTYDGPDGWLIHAWDDGAGWSIENVLDNGMPVMVWNSTFNTTSGKQVCQTSPLPH